MKFASIASLLASTAIAAASGDGGCTPPTWEGLSPTIDMFFQLTTGDFFSNLIAGAKEQASLLGATVRVYDAGGDDNLQAYLLATQTVGNPIGIVTVGSSGDALCEDINNLQSRYDDVVVSFDMAGEACSPTHVTTSQADDVMATLVLDQALKDLGRDVTVGYVNDLNYAPLAKRNEVWELYKEANNWTQQFFVADAANFSSAEALQSAIEEELEGAAPVDFIYAPWDYLSINTVAALRATNASGTAVYGADFNDEDIAVMIEPDSPWKATAGGDPRAIGAALIRMVAIDAAGELDETQVTIPSVLVTQSYLLDNNITDLMELDDANPELELPDFMRACWIPERGTGENDDSSSARALSTAAALSLAVGVASAMWA